MILASNTPCQYFPIWNPKYSTQHDPSIKETTVLLDKNKVGLHNEVVFTRAKSPRFSGSWYVTGEEARKWPVVTNGTIPCYQIPFSRFTVLERRSEARSVVDTPYPEIRSSQIRLSF